MRIAVLGATGFVGRALVPALAIASLGLLQRMPVDSDDGVQLILVEGDAGVRLLDELV